MEESSCPLLWNQAGTDVSYFVEYFGTIWYEYAGILVGYVVECFPSPLLSISVIFNYAEQGWELLLIGILVLKENYKRFETEV